MRPAFAYFPFGGGPRRCIGSACATTEMQMIVATVVQHYRLTLLPGVRVSPPPASRCARAPPSRCARIDGDVRSAPATAQDAKLEVEGAVGVTI